MHVELSPVEEALVVRVAQRQLWHGPAGLEWVDGSGCAVAVGEEDNERLRGLWRRGLVEFVAGVGGSERVAALTSDGQLVIEELRLFGARRRFRRVEASRDLADLDEVLDDEVPAVELED